MSRRVQAVDGEAGVVLPDGWTLDGGDIVVVSDTTWTRIEADAETLERVLDLGFTLDLPTPVPTWRDIQRAIAGTSTGLEAQIDAVSAELTAHEADTTNVHGIADTALLETQAGAQTKADQALDDAEAFTNLHASQTTTVHGIADTSMLATKAYVDSAVAGGGAGGGTLTYQHVQSTPAAEWTVTHNLGRYPAIVLRLSSAPEEPVYTDVTYVDGNTALVTWPSPESGWADV